MASGTTIWMESQTDTSTQAHLYTHHTIHVQKQGHIHEHANKLGLYESNIPGFNSQTFCMQVVSQKDTNNYCNSR